MGLNRDEIARHKRVVVRQEGDHVHEEHFVEDIGLENRQMVYKSTQLVWLIFGLLEALIGFRIILKLIAANPGNWFTAFVYQLSDIFVWPFQNIIVNPSIQNFVLELTSLIAMLVYAFVGWVIIRLIWVVFYRQTTGQVTTYDRDQM